jgi:hypothetical protein
MRLHGRGPRVFALTVCGGLAAAMLGGCLVTPATVSQIAAGRPVETTLPDARSHVDGKGGVSWAGCLALPSGEVRQSAYVGALGWVVFVPGGACRGPIEAPAAPSRAIYLVAEGPERRLGVIDPAGCNMRYETTERIHARWMSEPSEYPRYRTCWLKPTCADPVEPAALAAAARLMRELADDPRIGAGLRRAALDAAARLEIDAPRPARVLQPAIFPDDWFATDSPQGFALCGWD